MLALQSMGSEQGPHNRPFGCKLIPQTSKTGRNKVAVTPNHSRIWETLCAYWHRFVSCLDQAADDNLDNLDNLHGVGLPNLIQPGPPPGNPILDEHENQGLNSFFDHFASNDFDFGARHGEGSSFQDEKGMSYEIPPNYVGQETSLAPRYGHSIDPHQLQPGMSNMYNNGMMPGHMPMVPPEASFDGTMQAPRHGFIDSAYPQPLQPHFQQPVNPQQYQASWISGYQPNINAPMVNGRPQVRFGSDATFHTSGYAASHLHPEPDVAQNLDWLEPSSATNTQPNTAPNTQPSSPNWSRKRKLGDEPFLSSTTMNGHGTLSTHSHSIVDDDQEALIPKASARKRRKPDVKPEPLTSEEDEPAPAPWPASKARPISKPTPPKRPSNRSKRKAATPEPAVPSSSSRSKPSSTSKQTPTKSSSSKTPSKPSLSRRTSTPGSHRQPLTQEQKKANHTNSEQRRRDATGRAYAEMYDLVPELETMGKMSTTRKLEQVVKKLSDLKEGNEGLRRVLNSMGG